MSRRRPRRPSPAFVLLSIAVLAAAASSCRDGGDAQTPREQPELAAECEVYVAAFKACLVHAAPAKEVESRASAVRAGLIASAHDEASREAERARCEQGTQQLREACR